MDRLSYRGSPILKSLHSVYDCIKTMPPSSPPKKNNIAYHVLLCDLYCINWNWTILKTGFQNNVLFVHIKINIIHINKKCTSFQKLYSLFQILFFYNKNSVCFGCLIFSHILSTFTVFNPLLTKWNKILLQNISLVIINYTRKFLSENILERYKQ